MTAAVLLLSSLLLASHPAAAAEITLDQALAEAGQQSPAVQRAESVRDEAHWRKVEAFSTFLPSLTGQGTYLAEKRYVLTDVTLNGGLITIPAIVPTSNWVLSAQYPLFEGFAGTLRYNAARSSESAAEKEFNWSRFETGRQVALQFFRALASATLKEVAEQNVRTLEDHLRDVSAFKRSGLSTNYDVLQVEVQVSEARSEALNAADNVTISKGRLAELLGSAEPRDPKGTLPALTPELVKNLSLDNTESRQDLQALNERVEALDQNASASNRHWVPKVGLFATYNYYNNRNDNLFDQTAYRTAWQAGFSLNWNIFDGFASTARAKQAVEQRVQLETNLHSSRLKARQDFDVYKRKYLYNLAVYRSRVDNIAKAREAVRLAREGRKAGVRTNTDLLDAEAELYRAEAGAINAQLGSIEALVNLELATGQQLLPL